MNNSSDAGAVPFAGQHTPGPWQAVATDPSSGGEFFWITATTPASHQEREIGTVSGPQNARNTANARLMAAAPDLLAAVRIARVHAALIKLAPERRFVIGVLDAAIALTESKLASNERPEGTPNPTSPHDQI